MSDRLRKIDSNGTASTRIYELIEPTIYAPNGTCVANGDHVGVQYDVTLSQRGIYLIRLVCDGVDYTYKIALQ